MTDLPEPTHLRVDQPACDCRGGFVAAISVDVQTGLVVAAAPILRWAIGRDWDDVKEQARDGGYHWKIDRLRSFDEPTHVVKAEPVQMDLFA